MISLQNEYFDKLKKQTLIVTKSKTKKPEEKPLAKTYLAYVETTTDKIKSTEERQYQEIAYHPQEDQKAFKKRENEGQAGNLGVP